MNPIIVLEPHMNGFDIDDLDDTITVKELKDFLNSYPDDAKVCISTTDSLYYATLTEGSISVSYVDNKDKTNDNEG